MRGAEGRHATGQLASGQPGGDRAPAPPPEPPVESRSVDQRRAPARSVSSARVRARVNHRPAARVGGSGEGRSFSSASGRGVSGRTASAPRPRARPGRP
jgi:hypothetical protein